jgi:glucosamine--fructose-6-phosphate aminotransferase (isomerizing)
VIETPAAPSAGARPNLSAETTALFREASAGASVVSAQTKLNRAKYADLGRELRTRKPRVVITCGRGSSDHAATFARYLIETRMGLMTASAAPSVNSVYRTEQDLTQCLFLAISQSGMSPDLLEATRAARNGGAIVVAIVNAIDSPLAEAAHYTLPLLAGPEACVAATKSFLASLSALVALVAAWGANSELQSALDEAPALLAQAWELDWGDALPQLISSEHLYVISRGLGLGVAREIALKFKETCGLHAEAFSAAEVQHGPCVLLDRGFGALLLGQHDATRPGIETLGAELTARGVPVLAAGVSPHGAIVLPTIAAHPAIEGMLLTQSCYRLMAQVAAARGIDPDRPPHLTKVTETV